MCVALATVCYVPLLNPTAFPHYIQLGRGYPWGLAVITRLRLSSALRVCRWDSPLPFRTRREREISQLQAERHYHAEIPASGWIFRTQQHGTILQQSRFSVHYNPCRVLALQFSSFRAVFWHYSSLYSVPCLGITVLFIPCRVLALQFSLFRAVFWHHSSLYSVPYFSIAVLFIPCRVFASQFSLFRAVF
jgi:hypothetical protein